MKIISRSNYEIFFVDYFDGKLDKAAQEQLFAFLRSNADLQEEFDRYSGIHAEPDLHIHFEGKDQLKRDTITSFNYKTWLVAYIENDLSAIQKREVDLFLEKNTSFKTELELLKQTRLIPDTQIIFNKKNALKRGAKVIYFTPAVKRSLSVAAALLIIALSYYLIRQQNAPQTIISEGEQKKKNELNPSPKSEIAQSNPAGENKKFIPVIRNKKTDMKKTDAPIDRSNYFAMTFTDPEAQEENGCDDYHPPVQSTISEPLVAENKPGSINYQDGAKVNFQGMTFEQIKLSQANLSEIFDDEDLKDLENIRKKNLVKRKANSSNLLELVSEEMQKISKATDISIEKKTGASDNSVTYAFEAGKNFSISHTTGK